MTILVTGGTGSLGRPTVALLTSAGREVRVFSRTPGPGRTVGDLTTGAGLASALSGVDTVLLARTDAHAANLITSDVDDYDHPWIDRDSRTDEATVS